MFNNTECFQKLTNVTKQFEKFALAEIDLLKILHDLKCLISACDTVVGWETRWNSNKVIYDLSSSYKIKKQDQLLKDLATRYDMTNMKPMQVNLQ